MVRAGQDATSGALDGLRVLDLTRYVAGPFCTMLLGDFGADVVKVERPGRGDDLRATSPQLDGENLFSMTLNRNKRSVALDLYAEQGRSLLRRLAAEADILVENFRAGTMEEMGCGWDALHALNPRLVMVRISGFGQDGPLSGLPAYDVIAQAMSGLMSATGPSDAPPTMAGSTLIDYTTGIYAALGATMAIRARDRTGEGQLVDCTLLDSANSFLMGWIPEFLLLGRKPQRMGSRDRYSAPAAVFAAGDGHWVHLVASTDKQFAGLARVIGRPELVADPRYARIGGRLEHQQFLEDAVSAWTGALGADAVVAALQEAGVPCAKVAEISDLVENPQVKHRGSIVEIEHPHGHKVPVYGPAFRLSGTPSAIKRGVPGVGQHTDEVLDEWIGSAGDEVARLRGAKVVA